MLSGRGFDVELRRKEEVSAAFIVIFIYHNTEVFAGHTFIILAIQKASSSFSIYI